MRNGAHKNVVLFLGKKCFFWEKIKIPSSFLTKSSFFSSGLSVFFDVDADRGSQKCGVFFGKKMLFLEKNQDPFLFFTKSSFFSSGLSVFFDVDADRGSQKR